MTPWRLVDKYVILDRLGRGSSGTVYLGQMDAGEWRPWLVVKRIHPELARDPLMLEFFVHEFRRGIYVNHPNVASVWETVKHDGTIWVVMEYLHGVSLRDLTEHVRGLGQQILLAFACRVVAEAADGLQAVHELRLDGVDLHLVHRGITPRNVLVTYDGEVKIMDLGLANLDLGQAPTRGRLLEKLAYMAPEQIAASALDHRVDIFALGVILWELTTGERLFPRQRGQSDLALLQRIQDCEVPHPGTRRAELPSELASVIMKALARDRDARFVSARDLARAVRGCGLGGHEAETEGYVRALFEDRAAAFAEKW